MKTERWVGLRVVCVAAVALAPSIAGGVPRSFKFEEVEALTARYQGLVCGVAEEELERLAADADTGVAMIAAWERARRKLLAGAEGAEATGALQRFVGFVEGRTGVDVPAWWERCALAARVSQEVDIVNGSPLGVVKLRNAQRAKAERRGDDLIVTRDGERWEIANADDAGPREKVEVASPADGSAIAYIACYSNVPFPHALYALDETTGKRLWSAPVWAESCFFNYEGVHFLEVQIVLQDDVVLVFGASRTVFLEAFDARTGENLWRFNGLYLEFKSDRGE